jgi:hypothetical protein
MRHEQWESGVFEVQQLQTASLAFVTHPIPHSLLPSSAQPLHLVANKKHLMGSAQMT